MATGPVKARGPQHEVASDRDGTLPARLPSLLEKPASTIDGVCGAIQGHNASYVVRPFY